MLTVNNLSFCYDDRPIINNLSLRIDSGKIYVLIGPSGCGKTTLLNIIGGIYRNYEGSIDFDNSGDKSSIALIPQDYGLMKWKTVWQNAIMGLQIKKKLIKENIQRVNEILHELKIYDKKDIYPSRLSGGQKQRVAIARAFAIEPALLLMDEPFAALDCITREEMQLALLKMWEKHKTTIIFVTHDIDEALFLGQKLLIFTYGKSGLIEIDNILFGKDKAENHEQYSETLQILRGFLRCGYDG